MIFTLLLCILIIPIGNEAESSLQNYYKWFPVVGCEELSHNNIHAARHILPPEYHHLINSTGRWGPFQQDNWIKVLDKYALSITSAKFKVAFNRADRLEVRTLFDRRRAEKKKEILEEIDREILKKLRLATVNGYVLACQDSMDFLVKLKSSLGNVEYVKDVEIFPVYKTKFGRLEKEIFLMCPDTETIILADKYDFLLSMLDSGLGNISSLSESLLMDDIELVSDYLGQRYIFSFDAASAMNLYLSDGNKFENIPAEKAGRLMELYQNQPNTIFHSFEYTKEERIIREIWLFSTGKKEQPRFDDDEYTVDRSKIGPGKRITKHEIRSDNRMAIKSIHYSLSLLSKKRKQ